MIKIPKNTGVICTVTRYQTEFVRGTSMAKSGYLISVDVLDGANNKPCDPVFSDWKDPNKPKRNGKAEGRKLCFESLAEEPFVFRYTTPELTQTYRKRSYSHQCQ